MQRLKPGLDIVLDILEAVAKENPANTFAQSILVQYQERGGLSKKQMEGLLGKAKKISTIPSNKIATLEAIILRKKEKTKSALPVHTPLYNKDKETGDIINSLLVKFPQHKRVLFLKSKFENNEPLSTVEISELKKFMRFL
jgi:hypothetical protein